MNTNPSQRDYALDFYRACLLAYVVCVIHPVYWFANGAEPFKSVILFEMPLIFFVAGAAANLANYKGKSLSSVFSSRVKRILMPYLAYVVLSLAAMAMLRIATGAHMPNKSFADYAIGIVLGIDLPGVPFAWHLWFVPVYFIISVSTPLQAWLINRYSIKPAVYAALCVLLWGGVVIFCSYCHLPHSLSQLLTQVCLYNIFYMLGFFFYRKLRKLNIALLTLAALALLAIVSGGDITGMQTHKFNQDHVFLAFGVAALLVLGLIASVVQTANNPNKLFVCGLNRWNKYGYTIYLWQNWCFFVLAMLAQVSGIPYSGKAIYLCWLIPSLYLGSWALSFLAVPLEKRISSIKMPLFCGYKKND